MHVFYRYFQTCSDTCSLFDGPRFDTLDDPNLLLLLGLLTNKITETFW